MSEIQTSDVEVTGIGGDTSTQFVVRCPKCHDEIHCAVYKWWETKCSCGYEWTVNITATGSKFDDIVGMIR